MKNQGWIKLHREMINWRWYKNRNVKTLFIHLALRANHEDGSFENVKITKGQLITGRKRLSEETGLSEREVRNALKKLVDTQEIVIKPTSKFSIITICKWDDYQGKDFIKDQPTTNDRPTIDQRATTNKNEKNKKNEKKIKVAEIEISEDNTKVCEVLDSQLNLKFSPAKRDNQKEKYNTDNVEDYLSKIVSQFCESFQTLRQCPYVIMTPNKEMASASKILKAFKEQCPDANPADTLIGLRTYFDQCININDSWLFDKMSLQLIESQFNQINNILRHGNKRKTNSKGATGQELAAIATKHFAK